MRNKKEPVLHTSTALNRTIEITKPWNKDMYDHNDVVAELMKTELRKKLLEAYTSDKEDTMRNIGKIINPVQYGSGYDYHQIYDSLNKEIEQLQNFWLAEEFPYGVEQGILSKVKHEFVGY
tara:strand:- start:598 stop:960 length:363 start_codon:yes stop_codon:yes gene_type:complete